MNSKLIFIAVIAFGVLNAYQNFHGCCLAPDNLTGWVVTIDSMIVLKTTNGGINWFEQQNPAAARKFFDITCRDNQKVWTCGILGEITHTSNGGQTWVHQIQGLAKYATRIEFIDDTLGWAVCGDGVVGKTTDGGAYWEQIFTPYAQAEFYGVSFIDANEGWVVSGWPDSLATRQGLIIHSTDGGFNWDSLYVSPAYEDFFDVHFFNHTDGIVVGGNEQDYSPIIWKTTDGGNNWSAVSAPVNAFYLRAIDFVDNLNGWAVGRFGTIIHTTDGGNTWNFQTNPATTTLFDVDFSDAMHGVACGNGIILYTTDGGQNWLNGSLPGIAEDKGIEVKTYNLPLSVFPNPFQNHLIIKFQIPNTKYQTNSESQIPSSPSPRIKYGAGSFSSPPRGEGWCKGLNSNLSTRYSLLATLRIYDATGRLVKTFSDIQYKTDNSVYSVLWSGTDDLGRKVPAGVYFVKFEAGNYKQIEKVILLR